MILSNFSPGTRSLAGINVCAECRHKTGLSQERWAERLDVSVETIRAWEGWHRIPTNAQVARMVDACGDSYFAYIYLVQTAGCLRVLPDAERLSLPVAAIRLINRVKDFMDRQNERNLLLIAEDGEVSEAERPLFEQILSDLQELIDAAYCVRFCEGGDGV